MDSKTLNGLKLITVKSDFNKSIKFESVDNLLTDFATEFKSRSFVVAYLDYAVMIGKLSDGKLDFPGYRQKFEPEYVQKLRIFNENCELLLWKTADGMKARLRKDGEGNQVYAVEADQVLYGTQPESQIQSVYSMITEERGSTLILPIENIEVDEKEKRVKIRTRNYVGFDPDTGQAGYEDCRFVKFVYNLKQGENHAEEE